MAEHSGDVSRVILQVGIHGDDYSAGSGTEAGSKRSRLTAIPGEGNAAYGRMPFNQIADHAKTGVGAAVVNEDDFVHSVELVGNSLQLLEQQRDVFCFIVNRDDEGNVLLHGVTNQYNRVFTI